MLSSPSSLAIELNLEEASEGRSDFDGVDPVTPKPLACRRKGDLLPIEDVLGHPLVVVALEQNLAEPADANRRRGIVWVALVKGTSGSKLAGALSMANVKSVSTLWRSTKLPTLAR